MKKLYTLKQYRTSTNLSSCARKFDVVYDIMLKKVRTYVHISNYRIIFEYERLKDRHYNAIYSESTATNTCFQVLGKKF